MPKAVLRKGIIVPLEPLPAEWDEGTTLEVEKAAVPPFDIDEWAAYMTHICADSLAEDEELMRAAIKNHREQSKSQVRRSMGLPA